jgi:flagellar hook-associated protein 1
MSLSSALATAMSGLSVNQAALSIVSSNVANAQTPGYVSQSLNQAEISTGGDGSSVASTGVNRELNQYIQSQLRTETSGGAYADQMSSVLNQLQSVYGTPGSAATLETAFSNFTTAVQSLSANSGNQSAQASALQAAQALTTQLNTTTTGIQTLRSNVQQDIGTSVTQANTALKQIATINGQLQGLTPTDPGAAALMDQRDNAVTQLSQLMGVNAVTNSANQTTVFTQSGIQLVGTQASQLSFSAQGALNANQQWSSNPSENGVGTLSLVSPNGSSTDLVATSALSSGRISADLQLRDTTLVQAQSQVDQLAASLSSTLSDQTTAGTAVAVTPQTTVAPQAGFNLNLSNVLPGNSINLTYTDVANGTQHQVTVERVDDPSALPLPTGSNPNNQVIGVNFSGGMSSVVSQLNAALGGSDLKFSNPSGSTLQVLDNGSGSVSIGAASVTTTTSGLAGGSAQLPLFTDGTALYTGAITATGAQQTGYAGRITVNPALVGNPSNFTTYGPATAAGDTTRSDFIYTQLTAGTNTYSPQTGLGSSAAPFTGTLTDYTQQFLSLQANSATNATQLQTGQDVVVNTLQQSFNTSSGVNIDNQMSNLIALQNSYAANAHVMSVIQSMMTSLMQVST